MLQLLARTSITATLFSVVGCASSAAPATSRQAPSATAALTSCGDMTPTDTAKAQYVASYAMGVALPIPARYVRKEWGAEHTNSGESVDWWYDDSPRRVLTLMRQRVRIDALRDRPSAAAVRRCTLATNAGRAVVELSESSSQEEGRLSRISYLLAVRWPVIDGHQIVLHGDSDDEQGRREQMSIASGLRALNAGHDGPS